MDKRFDRRELLRLGGAMAALTALAACDTTGFAFAPGLGGGSSGPSGGNRPAAGGARRFGNGPVKVALLLPLSGDTSLAAVGQSLANAAQLAMDYVASTPKIGTNITIEVLDTGATAPGAAQRASEAVAGGAKLILGPLRGDQVEAAGAVAQAAKIPLIGFSNNSAAAAPGVYLLNVLPDTEVHRSLGYALAHGRKAIAALFPTTDFGRAQRSAFQTVAAGMGVSPRSGFTYGGESDLKTAMATLGPQIASGAVDALFMPDRATAPMLAKVLRMAGAPQGKALIIGSADWDGDSTIAANSYFYGAVYPAVDDTGYAALKVEYQARFGGTPHPLATIGYTAAIMANAAPLALANPPYAARLLTAPGGFNGRDGVFRFLPDGRSQYALVMKQITAGGVQRIEGPKL